ncbi:U-box domain-containing protein 21 [Dorcoceras hygrometricum]|uniref:U-box domain-containing protein 21 n=1 Tax=Dorcoceras hygrometricum TaxID=472368 RepID=A0A2Z7CM11_9LAMI|nr:U-box domain-containing protein 21 [Dorcoceras hygrometricum]
MPSVLLEFSSGAANRIEDDGNTEAKCRLFSPFSSPVILCFQSEISQRSRHLSVQKLHDTTVMMLKQRLRGWVPELAAESWRTPSDQAFLQRHDEKTVFVVKMRKTD